MNYLCVIFKNLIFFYINYNFAHFKQIKKYPNQHTKALQNNYPLEDVCRIEKSL